MLHSTAGVDFLKFCLHVAGISTGIWVEWELAGVLRDKTDMVSGHLDGGITVNTADII